MSKQQELLERIQAEFQPHFATVENESHMHSSGRGSDSHFKLVIVSDAFEGMRKVQ
ncbi:MAG: BolA family protein, partial [Haemophilus parainfluenzae]|nr:BolA family protein [Haemophilus parainfluenzae]